MCVVWVERRLDVFSIMSKKSGMVERRAEGGFSEVDDATMISMEWRHA